MMAAVVFGGVQSLIGPVVISFLLVAVPELLRFFVEFRLIIYGILIVITMVFRPQGILGYKQFSMDWLKRLFRKNKSNSLSSSGSLPGMDK